MWNRRVKAMKKLILGALLTWIAFGPVQDVIQAGNNPLVELDSTLNQTQQRSVAATCEATRLSTGVDECEIELRDPAELAAQAGQG